MHTHENKDKICYPEEIIAEHQASIGELRSLIQSYILNINKEQDEKEKNALPLDKFITSITKLGDFFIKLLKIEQSFYGISINAYKVSLFSDGTPENDDSSSGIDRDDLTLMHEFSESALENYEKTPQNSTNELLKSNNKHSYLNSLFIYCKV